MAGLLQDMLFCPKKAGVPIQQDLVTASYTFTLYLNITPLLIQEPLMAKVTGL